MSSPPWGCGQSAVAEFCGGDGIHSLLGPHVDLAAIIAILRAASYAGWLSLEFEGAQDPLTVGVPASLLAAKQLLG